MTADSPSAPAASIVIPTRNRKDILRQCIESCLKQSVPVEIVVVDDGSTDGTGEMIKSEFPQVRYKRLEGPSGPSLVRNIATEMATARIVFPIDDDSIFASARTVEQTLKEFDHPRVGAVAIPFINVRQDQTVRTVAPDNREIYAVHAYVGASHAVRRDLFLKLGGYRPWFFYMGEEGEYCIRQLNAGYITRLGSADPIHHHESPIRDRSRADHYGRRNDVAFVWLNVPARFFVAHMSATLANGVMFGFRVKRPWRMIKGLSAGLVECFKRNSERDPVSPGIYQLFRRLKKVGMLRLSEIEPILPPPE